MQKDERVRSVCPLLWEAARAVPRELAWTAACMDLWMSMQVQPCFSLFKPFLVPYSF